ncbi:hypothetical protein L1987_61872 [Smallanthus sonchifolius]|uniref:Uncharacterized protein n=1 Tax=Smallanthus sonchifolius TaxID=185202 RepID=A0ACB9C943_9ASTR|nr:hypothetical protein L1987_61872 [Smallanthus sonchifolius]
MGDEILIPETFISKLDASDPLYLHASDSSCFTVVNIKLKGTENYTVWANAMKLFLQAKNKLGFIDGNCKKSTDNEVLALQWERCNSVVLTWILNSVSDELYVGQVYSKLASEVWTDLRETYDKVDGSVVFNLYQKINSVSQNGTSVSEYYHKLNTMWKQFDAIVQLPSCVCNASKAFNDFNQLIKLMQFLMGLDDIYQPVRTSLLTQDPLPTIKTAFSIISREESHRGSFTSSKSPNVGFVSKTKQFFDNKKKIFKGPNPNLKCTHCSKLGHTVEKCFELVGFPQGYKFKAGQGSNQVNKNGVSNNTSNSASASIPTTPLSSDQITKLLSLLNERTVEDPQGSNVGGTILSSFSANCFSKCVYGISSESNSVASGWVIDSGANQHMIMSDKNLLNQIDVSDFNITVKHPNGTNAKVTKIGCLKITDQVILSDVFVVPEYYVNLMSVYKLTRDNKLCVVFDEHQCSIQDLYTKKTLVTGSQIDGLYLCGDVSNSSKVCFNSFNVSDLWHSRLGHPSEHVLTVLKNRLKIEKIGHIMPCDVCHRAKQHREPFPLSDHKSSAVGELVHLDVWGPYKVQSREGYKYFLTIVDDYTRSVWVYLLKNKSEVFFSIEIFCTMIKTQFDRHVKVFRSDNGTEFVNNQMSDFVKKNGIIHQTSCAHTPQQNDIVERKHRHLLNVARTLLFQSGVPLGFWSDCVLTAAYLINRTPSSILNGKSPYELMFNFQPSLNHLRVFGCLCFSTILNNTNKFAFHAEKCVFIGYSFVKKGFKLWSLDKKQVLFSRDVKFYETIFPFKESKLLTDHVFTPASLINSLNFFDVFYQSQSKDPNGEIPNDEEGNLREKPADFQQPESYSQTVRDVADSGQSNIQKNTSEVDLQSPHQSTCIKETCSQQSHGSENNTGEAENVARSYDEQNSPEGINDPVVSVRRSNRNTVFPKKLNDFLVEGKVKYGMEKVVNYSKLSFENKCFATNLNKSVEPNSFKNAKHDVNWLNAMNEEMEALNRNNTWTLVHLPKGRKPIGCRWIYKIKYKSNGEIERYKARLVAKGYSQKEGVDFYETFSPVVKMTTIRCVIAIAVEHNWSLFQLDVNNAFLYGDLQEDVYMCLPEGYFSETETKVCKLNKSLYGLKQAPRMWNEKLVGALLEVGFVQSKCDYSLFVKIEKSMLIVLLVYVDDIVVTGNDLTEIEKIKHFLKTKFLIKDLGVLKYFLGIEVIKSEKGICLNQRKYCMDLLTEFGLSGCKPVNTPIEQHYILMGLCKKNGSTLLNVSEYQKLIGKLIYLSHTRPDISYAVQFLSQFMHKPTNIHLQIALRLLRYLKRAPGNGILFSKGKKFDISAYANSDWGKCLESRRSVTGFAVFLGNCLVSWKSKKQSTVSRSSAEAEYRSMCAATCEVMWLINVLNELQVPVKLPVDLFCDNNAAVSIAANPVFHDRTKHFELDLFFLREKISSGVIKTVFVKSEYQVADVFTKGLLANQHAILSAKLGMFNCFGL